ncbi:MAG TPA: VTC domain-containing protein [Kofleriaceae bacterium]|nr:VTC domain-containing protein [Kofleriaceae bacterium]
MGQPWHEVERRFLVDADDAARFLAAVRPYMPLCLHDPSRPVEFVRSTYFDTDELTLFRTQGPGAWRVRIRQYASAPDLMTPPRFGGACAFEVKEITPHGRRKQRAVGTPTDITALVSGRHPAPARADRWSALDHARQAVEAGTLRPQLTTWFRRLSYAASGARVTVDQGIEFARPAGVGTPGQEAAPTAVVGRGPPLVLEVKLRVEQPAWLSAAVRRLLVITQFSKFRDGLLSLGLASRAAVRDAIHGAHPPGAQPVALDARRVVDPLRQLFGVPGPLVARDPDPGDLRATNQK